MTRRRSLAAGAPPSAAWTLYALTLSGEASFAPAEFARDDVPTVLFGRNKAAVHVCVGEDDPEVSRQHGRVVFHDRHLADLQPDAGWTPKKVEWLVKAVRDRLTNHGVQGLQKREIVGVPELTEDERGVPVGNALNENLVRELMLSTTLVPRDLALLDD